MDIRAGKRYPPFGRYDTELINWTTKSTKQKSDQYFEILIFTEYIIRNFTLYTGLLRINSE